MSSGATICRAVITRGIGSLAFSADSGLNVAQLDVFIIALQIARGPISLVSAAKLLS